MNNIRLSNRLLWHSIDAATLKADKGRPASWPATFAVLVPLGLVIAALLWADRAFA